MLTIITPVYCQSKKSHLYERTIFFIKNSYTTKKIKRIIVDFGSLESISSELVHLCKMYNIKYYNLGLKGNPFSAGECRNFGMSKAGTDYITFQDVDLYAPNSTYEKIIQHLQDKIYYNDVECIPCLYLTEEFSNQYLLNENWNESHEMAYESYKGNKPTIKMYAPVTSMILIRRQYILESGGCNTEFYGHGYEDFELLNRVANRSNKFVRSRDFYNHDYKYDSAEYCGYRPYFSLFGRELMKNKIFFVHIWHPENIAPSYSTRNKVNKGIFNKLLRKFDTELFMPPAISGVSEGYDGKTLILSPFHGKTTNSIRVAIPYLGDCIYKKDKEFLDVNSFVDFLSENSVKRVVFFNSYGNPHRLELYNSCLKHKIKTINYDRGGLPDTWFFDSEGFNSTSTSYSPKKWDIELDTEQTDSIQEYIQKTLISDQTLEKNGERIGSVNFSKKYNIQNKKVIFVPLQRPNDSVIKYFSDSIKSVDNFIHEIKILANKIKEKNWVFIIKQHPLERL
jgi:predicted glycosyltransferase involved in capsule biosynthesis